MDDPELADYRDDLLRRAERQERRADLDDMLMADAPPVDTAGNPVDPETGRLLPSRRRSEDGGLARPATTGGGR